MNFHRERFYLTVLLAVMFSSVYADIPSGYYGAADGKTGEALRQALHSIIDNHTSINYGALEEFYAQTDLDENGYIMDMYSTCRFTMSDANCSQNHVCQCWNKEHSIPSSWFKKGTPMYSDLFHVIPTDARVNNYRGNMPYGETSSTAYIASDSHSLGHIGTSNRSGFSGTVFEPADEYKGDLARNYLYMATRYTTTNFTQSTGSTAVFSYTGGTAYLTDYAIELFLKWHRQDPVSQKEIDRNNAVYGIQHNRNPFIDYPYLAEYIWGTKKGSSLSMERDVISSADEQFVPGFSDGSTASLSPSIHPNTTAVNFPSVGMGETAVQTLTVTGNRLTGGIDMVILGADNDLFSLSPLSIKASVANTANTVTITYSPTQLGTHTATLRLLSVGATSVDITLQGTCAETHSIQWMVNEDIYTAGHPDTQAAHNGTLRQLPTQPASCSAERNVFVGWTQVPISGMSESEPADLFATLDEAPLITQDVTFYAVFANEQVTTGTQPVTQTADLTNYKNGAAVTTVTVGNAVITFNKNDASNEAKYYTSSNAVRTYAGSQIIISGKNMTSIVFTFASDDHSNAITANTGTFVSTTWTGKADEVVFSIGGSSKYRAIQSISITSQAQADTYTYRDFITSCSTTTDTQAPALNEQPKAVKLIINGQLWLRIGDDLYDSMGRKQQ